MSHGREVSIVAVDGGFIVEYNDLIQGDKDIGKKTPEGTPIKIPTYESGKRQVAVRSTVEDVMKLLAGLLIVRMEVKGVEKVMMEKYGALCYESASEKYAMDKPSTAVSESYASKA